MKSVAEEQTVFFREIINKENGGRRAVCKRLRLQLDCIPVDGKLFVRDNQRVVGWFRRDQNGLEILPQEGEILNRIQADGNLPLLLNE